MLRPTCGDYVCVLSPFAHEAAGAAWAPGIPCALRLEGHRSLQSSGAIRAAGMRRCVLRPMERPFILVMPGTRLVKLGHDGGVVARMSQRGAHSRDPLGHPGYAALKLASSPPS